jgi:Ca2+-binding EF-hand superfamily protein
VQLGLNKIQLKKLFAYLDKGKQGYIISSDMLEAAESIR